MGIIWRKEEMEKMLEQPPIPGKYLLEPLKSFVKRTGASFNVLRDSFVSDNLAEVHEDFKDLWICLEGKLEFVCGGELVEPQVVKGKKGEWIAREIVGGLSIVLKAGDILEIPAGEAHTHKCPDGTATLVIIKIPISK